MAPQLKEIDDKSEDVQTSTTTDDELRTPTGKPFVARPYPMATPTISGIAPEFTSVDNSWRGPNYPPYGRPTGPPSWASVYFTTHLSSSYWITTTKVAPLEDGAKSSQAATSPFLVSTTTAPEHSYTSYGYGHGHGRPGWPGAKEKMYSGRIIATATVTSVVSLAVIGAVVLFCMRKRKRQRQGVVGHPKSVQEMKIQTQSHPTAEPYLAPVQAVAPSYAGSPNHLMPLPSLSAPPIILGPIPSGPNGAYGTGIDTSDMISVTSANDVGPGPSNPFSDNDSLAEPPPPYRPRSAAPPSLTNSSRHSSFRISVARPATSQTHLIERSPFEDPDDDDDDAVSELSGSTVRQTEDTMSAVSDMSYQNDPVANGPSS